MRLFIALPVTRRFMRLSPFTIRVCGQKKNGDRAWDRRSYWCIIAQESARM